MSNSTLSTLVIVVALAIVVFWVGYLIHLYFKTNDSVNHCVLETIYIMKKFGENISEHELDNVIEMCFNKHVFGLTQEVVTFWIYSLLIVAFAYAYTWKEVESKPQLKKWADALGIGLIALALSAFTLIAHSYPVVKDNVYKTITELGLMKTHYTTCRIVNIEVGAEVLKYSLDCEGKTFEYITDKLLKTRYVTCKVKQVLDEVEIEDCVEHGTQYR